MKKLITQNQVVEIEFEIPCYVKFGTDHFWKIMDDKNVLIVKTYEFSSCIEIGWLDHNDPFGNKGYEFITKEEFQKAFDTAFERLSTLTEFPNLNSQPA